MIDYTSWAKEYSSEVAKLNKAIKKLTIKREKCENRDERHSIDVRINRLNALVREHGLIAKHLKERGASSNGKS